MANPRETRDSRESTGPRNPRNPRDTREGRPSRPSGRRFFSRRKVCKFCVSSDLKLNYKYPEILKGYLTDRGKIIPRRVTGNCAKHQRALTREIKRARNLALLPFVIAES